MIKLEDHEVMGWEHVIRGMRNPMNSWAKSDSDYDWPEYPDIFRIGPNDHELMMRLAKNGPVHAKYRRMITVYVDITAPLYWWKEFDTYKVGTVANSCSTMHKIHEKEFSVEDFSCERLFGNYICGEVADDPFCSIDLVNDLASPFDILTTVIAMLNKARDLYIKTKDKLYWWQMIQLLPSSYNQKRTVMLNYEVLNNIYESRKNHKLKEWREFCKWIEEELPYNELITGEAKDE